MDELSTSIEVAKLDQKYIDLKEIIVKLESAIEKMNDVNANITKMLAVHEERINNTEKNNQTIFNSYIELSNKIEAHQKEHTISEKEFTEWKGKITGEVDKVNLKIVGAATLVLIIGFVITNGTYFGNLLHLGKLKSSTLTNPSAHAMIL
jgi:predicted  nucleic acid-binding Zn-ribbon protein